MAELGRNWDGSRGEIARNRARTKNANAEPNPGGAAWQNNQENPRTSKVCCALTTNSESITSLGRLGCPRAFFPFGRRGLQNGPGKRNGKSNRSSKSYDLGRATRSARRQQTQAKRSPGARFSYTMAADGYDVNSYICAAAAAARGAGASVAHGSAQSRSRRKEGRQEHQTQTQTTNYKPKKRSQPHVQDVLCFFPNPRRYSHGAPCRRRRRPIHSSRRPIPLFPCRPLLLLISLVAHNLPLHQVPVHVRPPHELRVRAHVLC